MNVIVDWLQYSHVQVLAATVALWLVYFALTFLNRLAARDFRNTVDRWSMPLIFVLGTTVLVSGSIGFVLNHGNRAESLPVALYETLQIYAFNIEPEKLHGEGEGFLQTAMNCATALYITVAVKGIWLLFRESFTNLKLQIARKHVVVCGLGRIGRQLVEDLLQSKRRAIVVIESDRDNEHLEWARDQGVLVIIGDATKAEFLRTAQVHRAEEVFLVIGKDECNIECAIELRDIMQKKSLLSLVFWRLGSPLKCRVHILDYDLELIVRQQAGNLKKTPNDPKPVPKSRQIDVEVFSALERTARRLLEEIAVSTFEKKFIRPDKDEVAHFVLLGFGEFAQTLALKLAEFAHFENGKRLRLTIVDRDIEKKAKPFIARHPTFGPEYGAIPAWDFSPSADNWGSRTYRPVSAARIAGDSQGIEYVCNAQYLEYVEVTEANFLAGLRSARTQGVRPVVLVCFEADRQNLAIAERLSAKLKTQSFHLPIFVWIPQQRELSQMLIDNRKKDTAGECDLIPFGQCDGSVSYSEITTSWSKWLARRLPLVWIDQGHDYWNEAVVELHTALAGPNATRAFAGLNNWKALEACAEGYWQQSKEWEQASNRSAAIHAVLKAAVVGQRIVDVAKTVRTSSEITVDGELEVCLRRMEHYRWVAERLIAGWRYDAKRDEIGRTRWQITPWEKLLDPPREAVEEAAAKNKTLDREQEKDARIVSLLLEFMRAGHLKVTPIA